MMTTHLRDALLLHFYSQNHESHIFHPFESAGAVYTSQANVNGIVKQLEEIGLITRNIFYPGGYSKITLTNKALEYIHSITNRD